MKELSPQTGRLMFRRNVILSSTMRNMGKPIVAAIKGFCLGVGNHLNLFSDLSIAADNAKFSQAGLKVATAPVWGGVQLLPRAIGDKKAREMIFLGRMYSASTALEMGLCNEVVPLNEIDNKVEALCQELLEVSPTALRISKLALNFDSDSDYPSFVNFGEMMSMLYGSEELAEGMKAFKEKRKPMFDKFR
jgi:1,4-dihydroxy-2-naphthoyl-CoA synthase